MSMSSIEIVFLRHRAKYSYKNFWCLNLNFQPYLPFTGDLRGILGGHGVRDAAVRAGDHRQHQAAAAEARGNPQAAHAPIAQRSVKSFVTIEALA